MKGQFLRIVLTLFAAAPLAGPVWAAPLPVAKPIEETGALPPAPPIEAAIPAPILFEDDAIEAIRVAISALDIGDLGGALDAVDGRPELEQDVVWWLAIRRQLPALTPQAVTAFASRNPHWPSATLFRRRAEQALVRMNLAPEVVVTQFGTEAPLSEEGMLALARALVELGRTEDAKRLLVPWWSTEVLSAEREQLVLSEFSSLLDRKAHKARYDMLMYADRMAEVDVVAPLVGKEFVALAEARRAVLRSAPNTMKLFGKVSGDARTDPLYAFSLAEFMRRGDRPREAAAVITAVPADTVLDHADAWWVERRIVSRELIEAGDYRLGYELAAGHRGGNAETAAEARFHAGWYALRFVKDPAKARPHFTALQASVSLPISRARAAYWLGRTEEAAGKEELARRHYVVAASDEQTFYGQLARVKLGQSALEMPPEPEPTAEDKIAFATNDLARATVLLIRAGDRQDAVPVVTELAKQLPSGGQIAILADYLTRVGDHRSALTVGKIAADRNLGTERLAYPVEVLPESGRHQEQVETAMVYAIARQESAFDPAAVSRAGAMGLLQLLPTTAQATAKTLGMPFSRPRLTTDATYNATLGAAHLRELVDDFGGSYVLAFAAYNAGPRKAKEWIQRFGDPRDPAVDPIDWIELIPYGETRSYVQRVTENLQVYRERLGDEKLAIEADLARGRPPAAPVVR